MTPPRPWTRSCAYILGAMLCAAGAGTRPIAGIRLDRGESRLLRSHATGQAREKGDGAASVVHGDCEDDYPGSTAVVPLDAAGPDQQCKCVVDPSLRESEEAWSCPEGFDLVFDEVQHENSLQIVAQWHCAKLSKVKEFDEKSQPAVCPAGWKQEGVTCLKQRSECGQAEKLVANLNSGESGVMEPESCNCESKFTLSCEDPAELDSGSGGDPACRWKVPRLVDKLEIQRPICKYVEGTATAPGMAPVQLEEPEVAATDPSVQSGTLRKLAHGDWKLPYEVAMQCPRVVNIPPVVAACGPRSPAGVFKVLETVMQIEDSEAVVSPPGDKRDTWWECSTKCAALYGKATECSLSSKYPCTVTSATPGINYANAKGEAKGLKGGLAEAIGNQHRRALQSEFQEVGGDECQGFGYPKRKGSKFTFIKRKGSNVAATADKLYTSAAMSPGKLIDRVDSLQQTVMQGLLADPRRALSSCKGPKGGGKAPGGREKDGKCKPNNKDRIDWQRSFDRLSRKVGSQLTASSNPFSVDCRAIANEIFRKGESFLECKHACDARASSKAKMDSKFNKEVFYEAFCPCGKVWAGKKSGCVVPGKKKKKKKKNKNKKNN